MESERTIIIDGSMVVRLRGTDQHGVTLVELLAVLSLISLLVIFAFLQLPPLLAQIQLDSGARQVVADLQVARMRAIAQNRRFRVTFRSNTHDYVVDKEEGATWTRLVLHGHTSEPAVDAFVALPPSVTISGVNSGGDVIFVPRGHVDGGISITLGSLAGAGTWRIIVNLAGRVRIE